MNCAGEGVKAPLTPVKAVRAKCLACAGGRKAVRECAHGAKSHDPRSGRNRGAPPLRECPFLPENPVSSYGFRRQKKDPAG